MNNTIKLVAAAGAALAGYESLKYGINKVVEQCLPELVAKYFPTSLLAGGAVLAAVEAVLSYSGIGTVLAAVAGSSNLSMNPPDTKPINLILMTGQNLHNLLLSNGTIAINELRQLLPEYVEILAQGSEDGGYLLSLAYKIPPYS